MNHDVPASTIISARAEDAYVPECLTLCSAGAARGDSWDSDVAIVLINKIDCDYECDGRIKFCMNFEPCRQRKLSISWSNTTTTQY